MWLLVARCASVWWSGYVLHCYWVWSVPSPSQRLLYWQCSCSVWRWACRYALMILSTWFMQWQICTHNFCLLILYPIHCDQTKLSSWIKVVAGCLTTIALQVYIACPETHRGIVLISKNSLPSFITACNSNGVRTATIRLGPSGRYAEAQWAGMLGIICVCISWAGLGTCQKYHWCGGGTRSPTWNPPSLDTVDGKDVFSLFVTLASQRQVPVL
jgi:hypothetical protein